MANWTVKQVTDWLKENGFKKQIKIFKDKNIDGHTLISLTDNDISKLFFEVNEDGTSQESTIGVKSRFRTKLKEWKMNNKNDETTDDSPAVVSSNVTDLPDSYKDKDQENVVQKKVKKQDSDDAKREAMYLIDDDIQVRFFNNQEFLLYFINYIKQETLPIEIQIDKSDSKNDDESLFGYIIKLTGTKQENRVVRKFIKTLLDSIKSKIYNQKQLKNWLLKSKSIHIIQNILNNKIHVFTVCQLINRTLEIYYFQDEKFHSLQNLNEIDNIIQNHIFQEDIIWSSIKNRNIIEFISLNTREILSKYQICQTKQFSEDFEQILNQYKQEHLLISVIINSNHRNRTQTKQTIEIFGYETLVNEALQKFRDLFDKHRLRKFKFSQISSTELQCLANLCRKELRSIENEFETGCVELHVQENQFYAPQCLKTEIRSRIKNLVSNLKTKTFKNIEFYHNIADILCLNMKNIAQRTRSYCEIKLKTKLKSYQIPRGHKTTLNTSKSIIEQSNLFCSSPLVFCQTKIANGSIEVVIGDIALQNVDILIIPSTSYGLKENLIERAGEISQKQSLNENNSISFITETTAGKLNCKKILFVNWSLPTMITNDDDLTESIQLFISKTIQYIITDSQQSNLNTQSIAFAVPDSCKQEEIFAEEIIEETINQMNLTKSLSLKVSFVLLQDQQTLHKEFLNAIQRIQKRDDGLGIFYCPTSTVTISLMSLDDDYLKKCEERISNYLKRSIFKMKLDGFQHWNQYMINAFYKYSIDRCVLPKTDNQQEIILYGPINNVYEVNQKYQLTKALIQEKINKSSTGYNIILSYSPKDSIISHRLANRLIDEGFSVWINSNQSIELDEVLNKINQSDCIILCISKNYFQDEFCEKQAKYAEQIGKNIIPIKVEYYQPIEWLQKLIEKESYLQLFGSDNHFNLEYDKLLLKIFQYTKPSSILEQNGIDKSLQNSIGLYFLLTSEQKKLKYEKHVKKLMKLEKGKIREDDKKDLFEKLEDILRIKENHCQKCINTNNLIVHLPMNPDRQRKQDESLQNIRFDIGIISYRQWLDKLGNLKTILNIAPFTFTGDINDAIFPLLNEVLKNSNLLFTLRTHYSMPIEPKPSSEDNIPVTKLKQRNLTIKIPMTDERSLIVSRLTNNSVMRYRKVNKFKENNKRRTVIPKKRPAKASFSKTEKHEFQAKFAKQMQKNEDEFQKFCENYEHSSQTSENRKIQTYATAIFGLSPFSDIKIEPVKRLPTREDIHLPLKFPWNGVFDTTLPSITWKNPSIIFFLEARSSEKH